ncbi:MAG: efflux RND transporter permease subunit [Leptospiraceae bacterium]|nr:efflux RND transporter permease subunit [Leptospiraceae bacterium]
MKNKLGFKLLCLSCILCGLFVLPRIRFKLEHGKENRNIEIETRYRSAGPERVEEEISIPLERELSKLAGIQEIYSISEGDKSRIYINLNPNINLQTFKIQAGDAIEKVSAFFPKEISRPSINGGKKDREPFLIFTLPEQEKERAQKLKKKLEELDGITEIILAGNEKEEFRIECDVSLMHSYGYSYSDIFQQFQKEHSRSIAGKLKVGDTIKTVLLNNRFENIKDLQNIFLLPKNSTAINSINNISNILKVERRAESYAKTNGKESLSFYIYSTEEENPYFLSQKIFNILHYHSIKYHVFYDKGELYYVSYIRIISLITLCYFIQFFYSIKNNNFKRFLSRTFYESTALSLIVIFLYLFKIAFELYTIINISCSLIIFQFISFSIDRKSRILFISQALNLFIFLYMDCGDNSAYTFLVPSFLFNLLLYSFSQSKEKKIGILKKHNYFYSFKTLSLVFSILFLFSYSNRTAFTLPEMEEDKIYFTFEFPSGTSLLETRKKAEILENRIMTMYHSSNITLRIEKGKAHFYIDILNISNRSTFETTVHELSKDLQPAFAYFPGKDGAQRENEIYLDLYGQNIQILRKLSKNISLLLKADSNITNILFHFGKPAPEYKVEKEIEKLKYSSNALDIGNFLRFAKEGIIIGKIISNEEEHDLRLVSSRQSLPEKKDLLEENLLLNEKEINLADIASIEELYTETSISRRNKKRSLRMSLYLKNRNDNTVNLKNKLQAYIKLPHDYEIKIKSKNSVNLDNRYLFVLYPLFTFILFLIYTNNLKRALSYSLFSLCIFYLLFNLLILLKLNFHPGYYPIFSFFCNPGAFIIFLGIKSLKELIFFGSKYMRI